METATYSFELPEGDCICLPSFTSSATFVRPRPAPEWVTAREAVEILKAAGHPITTQTLFNREKDGRLHTKRVSERKVYFDLNEIRSMTRP